MPATPRTYLITPRTAAPKTTTRGAAKDSSYRMMNALMRFLNTLDKPKLRQASQRQNPDLLIIVPRRNDQMTIEDLLFLRSATGCKRTLVLDIAHRLPALPTELLPWLNVINSPSFDFEHMGAWLKNQVRPGPELGWPNRSVDNIKAQMGRRVGIASSRDINDTQRFTRRIDQEFVTKIIGHETTPKLLKAPSMADFYYGLIRLGGKYAVIEHDLNRALSDLVTSAEVDKALAEIGQLRIVRRFVDVCQDTLMALRFPLPKRLATNNGKSILLIDDNPESVAAEIRNIIQDYKLELTLDVCNPCEKWGTEHMALLQVIAEYSSLSHIDFAKPLCPGLLLKDVSSRCACILVDVLFGEKNGMEEEAGIRVIEGLTRILQD